jgi:hypothetical protein
MINAPGEVHPLLEQNRLKILSFSAGQGIAVIAELYEK